MEAEISQTKSGDLEQYDIVIIGSGLGGLVCGYILGREGKKVLILEKNRQIGGSLQTFTRDKTLFDTGIHYIGGLSPGQNLYKCFKYLGLMDKLKLSKMDERGFDRIGFEGDQHEYLYSQGYDNFVKVLSEQFPHEADGIRHYANSIKEVCDHFPMYNLEPDSVNSLDFTYLGINARDFIASCVRDPLCRAVLGGTNPLYAGTGDTTPLYVHALINNTYIESSWRCIDGGSQISKYLAKSIKGFGGKVLRYKEAKKFIFEGSELSLVEMADGERFRGKIFISNIHPAKTLDMLPEGKVRPAYRHRIQSLENTVSIFIVHVVFKENTFPYKNYNYYHYKSLNIWDTEFYTEENWPESYSIFWGLSSKTTKYADSMNIMTYMRFEEVREWADTFNIVSKESDRGKAYEEFKKQKAEKLLAEVEKKYPGIRASIKSYYTSTPLTLRDYIGSDDGALYGIAKDYRDPLRFFISPRTKVPNLLLTGQNLNLHGVLGVTISAIQTCGEIIGLNYLVKAINEANLVKD